MRPAMRPSSSSRTTILPRRKRASVVESFGSSARLSRRISLKQLEAAAPRHADMLARRFLGGFRIAALDRFDDAAMLEIGAFGARRHAKGGAVQDGNRIMHRVQGLRQIAVVRRLMDGV